MMPHPHECAFIEKAFFFSAFLAFCTNVTMSEVVSTQKFSKSIWKYTGPGNPDLKTVLKYRVDETKTDAFCKRGWTPVLRKRF